LIDFLKEIPTIGMGIDFSKRDQAGTVAKGDKTSTGGGSFVDLGKVLLNTSYLEDSILDSTNQSYLDESFVSLSMQNEHNMTISEILNQNENEVKSFFFSKFC